MGSSIPSLEELKKLSLSELELLAHEIRARIVSVTARNGGHLGASLGAVEIAIALHYVFRSPDDAIVWDVGHQAYAHKLLTLRSERFDTLRKKDGLSGFLSRAESPHDVFGAGHSSTSLSAALGLSWRKGPHWTIAVIGDGGLTSGLALEALNNISGTAGGPLLVILNDNRMSISANVGALNSILLGGEAGPFFSQWGLEYVGPGDGHNLNYLLGSLKAIRDSQPDRPLLLHLYTEKGHGYAPAEERPSHFHGISPVPASKVTGTTVPAQSETYSQRFARRIIRHAEMDENVVAVTAAMAEGTGLHEMALRFPDRVIDVGIAEGHAVTFAAGLAAGGRRPVVAIYSTFLQRSVDQLIHDVGLQSLPVIIGVDRAGMVGQDGATHQGVYDLSYLLMIPGFTVYAPASLAELDVCVDAAFACQGPVAIRYPRGSGPISLTPDVTLKLKRIENADLPELVVVALGPSVLKAGPAVQQLKKEGRKVSLWATVCAKPIDPELIKELRNLAPHVPVVTLEEGAVPGGFGSRLRVECETHRPFHEWGYPDRFIDHATPPEQDEEAGMSAQRLTIRLRDLLT